MEQGPNQNQNQNLKNKRHEYTVHIRMENRQKIFNSKRFRFDEEDLDTTSPPLPIEQERSIDVYRQVFAEAQANRDYDDDAPVKILEPIGEMQFEANHEGYRERQQEANQRPQVQVAGTLSETVVLKLRERAQELYGPRVYPPRQIVPSAKEECVVLDDNLGDFILDTLSRPYTLDDLSDAIECLRQSDDDLSLHRGAIMVRKLVCKHGKGYQWLIIQLVQEKLVPIFLDMFAQDHYRQLQFESSWILSNIAANEDYCKQVVREGIIERVLKTLRCSEVQLLISALWMLGNISADLIDFKNEILDLNGMAQLISLAQDTKLKEVLAACVWNVNNLMNGVDYERYSKEMEAGIAFLCHTLAAEFITPIDPEFADAVNVLRIHANTHLPSIARTGFVPVLLKLCRQHIHIKLQAYEALVKLVAAFSSHDDPCLCELMLNHGLLDAATQWLRSGRAEMIEDGLYVLSNAAVSTTNHTGLLLAAEEILAVASQLMLSESHTVQKQACIFFINLAELAEPERVFDCYAQFRILGRVFSLLDEDYTLKDIPLLNSVLSLLQRVLECGDLPQNRVGGENVFQQQVYVTVSTGQFNNLTWMDYVFFLDKHQQETIAARVHTIIRLFFAKHHKDYSGEGDRDYDEEDDLDRVI